MMRAKNRIFFLSVIALGLSGCIDNLIPQAPEPKSETASPIPAEEQMVGSDSVEDSALAVDTLTTLPEALPTSLPNENGVSVTPGQCWVYAQQLPKPVADSIDLVVKDSETKLQVSQAELRSGTKQVVTREGTKNYKVVPATYKKISEKVEVRPEISKIIVEPAVFKTEVEEVVYEEARTVLKPCSAAGAGYYDSMPTVGLCSVEEPAKTKKIQVQKLVKPEQSRVEIIPAQYKTVSRWVVDTPAQLIPVEVQEKTKDFSVEELVQAPHANEVVVPESRQNIRVTRFEGEPKIVVKQAVCQKDLNNELVVQIQSKLADSGYQPGKADGFIGPKTIRALREYQVDNGLAAGAITVESVEHLGIVLVE